MVDGSEIPAAKEEIITCPHNHVRNDAFQLCFIQQLSMINSILTKGNLGTVIHALISSRLDNCTS